MHKYSCGASWWAYFDFNKSIDSKTIEHKPDKTTKTGFGRVIIERDVPTTEISHRLSIPTFYWSIMLTYARVCGVYGMACQ